ncbi:hypothetical protein BHE74_00038330 [Ensete ventricosum]|nr:hypothetical protein BHE74_00038330 [Ensete ventricosum]
MIEPRPTMAKAVMADPSSLVSVEPRPITQPLWQIHTSIMVVKASPATVDPYSRYDGRAKLNIVGRQTSTLSGSNKRKARHLPPEAEVEVTNQRRKILLKRKGEVTSRRRKTSRSGRGRS